LKSLLEWVDLLISEGPKYGVFPEFDKSYCIVSPDYIDDAKELFSHLKINVVTGRKFLGVLLEIFRTYKHG